MIFIVQVKKVPRVIKIQKYKKIIWKYKLYKNINNK